MIDKNISKEKNQDNIIYSFISLRNCFIFLEYLYLFLCKNPDEINHYIIKIDISLLLDIAQKTSGRLINSEEFFYLNLIELKGLFKEIKYVPSDFIDKLESSLYFNYLSLENALKIKKLKSLKTQLSYLIMTLIKYNNNISNNNIQTLIDYIEEIHKKLSKDLDNKNPNYDNLIQKYIFKVEKYEKKNLKQILDEIKEKNIIENCNYLYLIALNNFKEIIEKEGSKKSEKNKKNDTNMTNDDENKTNNNENKSPKDEHIILHKALVEENKIVKGKVKNDEKEKIIKMEELRLEIKFFEEQDISELVIDDIKKDEDKETKYIEKKFTYNKVLNLNKNNIYNILFFLDIYDQFKENNLKNIDELFVEYKNNFISSVKKLNCINYNSFYDLISDNDFKNEIIALLKSKPIHTYLNEYRYYDVIDEKNKNQNEYEFKFVKKGEDFVENLSNEYQKLMEYLKDDIFFINLFRLKYLPLGIKAFVNYNLKIFVNSLHYEFNENIDENNKNIIFRAALKIIIIHEIIHILKYLKNNIDFNNIPETPREREGGKMFINYLFGMPVIKSINLEQAKKINNINFWEDVEILRKIFPKEDKLIEKDKSYNNSVDHVDLYFTEEDIEDENLKTEKKDENIDIGIDID